MLESVLYVVIALSAARWWMRPLMLSFDKHFNLAPCRESDFFFFCWAWPVVVVLMGAFVAWKFVLKHVLVPLTRPFATTKKKI